MSDPKRLSIWARVGRAQSNHPFRFLFGALLISIAATPVVAQLSLNSDFQALLPESAPSVRDLDEIRERFGGTATLALAIQALPAEEGGQADVDALHAFTRELVPRIESARELQVTSVDWNIGEFERFVEDHRHLYADLDDLTEIRDALRDRLDWERARANPFFIDLGEEPPPDPQAVIDRMRHDAEEARHQMDRFPGGFYQHPRMPLLFVFVHTSIRGGEVGATDRLIAHIERVANEIAGGSPTESRGAGGIAWQSGGLRIDYAGDIMDVREENEALKDAVEKSTLVTAVLLLASIYVFFLRKRAVPILGLALVTPTLVTFAIAEWAVDYLNASSAFLGSIVVGNGVNPQVMWLGRYFEERRAGRGVDESVRRAHEGTWAGTLAATFAAALAYGSLLVTDYRGFRDFGLIGAIGMSLCWVSAYTVLPALVTASERWRPMTFGESERRMKGVYGVLFARLALGRPGVVLAVSALLSVVALAGVGWVISSDPLEYDFRNLQAERSPDSRVQWANDRAAEFVEETTAGSALAILSPRAEDVPELRAQLLAYSEAHPGVLGAVRTIQDLMPGDQERKIPILGELRQLMLDARPYLSEEQQREVDAQLPPEQIAPVVPEDLPASVARPFIERDGTRGRLVFAEHADGAATWDGRYMIQWSEAVRSAHTADGHSPAVAGIAVVFADLLSTIFRDGPRAIGASFLATAILLLFTFRRQRERLLSLASMLCGVAWMLGVLAALGTKLNFLNMVAFPITFGIGVEYGVNYVKRFLEEKETTGDGPLAARLALEGAGGAVILCSLTTLIGYVSLYTSANRALNSFGLAMSLGEITCLVASLLALPAALYLLERRKTAGATGVK